MFGNCGAYKVFLQLHLYSPETTIYRLVLPKRMTYRISLYKCSPVISAHPFITAHGQTNCEIITAPPVKVPTPWAMGIYIRYGDTSNVNASLKK